MAWKPEPGMGDPGVSWMAQAKSLEFFLEYIEGRDLHSVDELGKNALFGATANSDPTARYQITSWLLDHGVDPLGSKYKDTTVLHNLFNRGDRDPVRDAELLRRLLEAAADINKSVPDYGRPLAFLMTRMEARLETDRPFFDIMFSRPDLDLVARSKINGESFAARILRMVKPQERFRVKMPDSPIEGMLRQSLLAQGHDPDVILAQVAGSGGGSN